MAETSITAASAQFGISTRTLRYGEQIGLIESLRRVDQPYRTYTPETVQRIGQILILRRLWIPLAEIAGVLDDPDTHKLLTVLQTNIARIDAEADALRTLRQALTALTNRLALHLNTRTPLPGHPDELTALLAGIPLPALKEDIKMSEFKKAEETLNQRIEVRYLYPPPMSVAVSHYIGPSPEDNAGAALDRFVLDSSLDRAAAFRLQQPQPGRPQRHVRLRMLADHPREPGSPRPLEKKHFPGELYAAHVIRMGDFHEWGPFLERLQADPDYTVRWREPYSMGGCLEEHLNAPAYFRAGGRKPFAQLDLLVPIEEK